MFRDAAYVTQDAKILDKMDMSVFCMDTVKRYRNFFRSTHMNHLWNNEDDEMFLRKIGAIGIGEDGKYHPTSAGLLMFGYEYEITREFPNYFLDYQENRSIGTTRWTDRIVSTSGDWSGNLFDFVIEALRRMQQGLKVPFVLKGNQRIDDTPIHKLLREAITNACVHADFYGRQGLVIQKSERGYRLSNPGIVRISISDAVGGGISDPRNSVLLKMFSLVEFGERAGSGLNGICKCWEKVYHTPVKIEETNKNGVDRTVLTLSNGGNEQDVKAMLELYGDLSEIEEPQINKRGFKIEDEPQSEVNDPQNEIYGPQNGVHDSLNEVNEPQSELSDPQNEAHEPPKEKYRPQNKEDVPKNGPQKLLETVRIDPKITKTALADMLKVSRSTLKRWLKANNVVWVGHSKNGHWQIQG